VARMPVASAHPQTRVRTRCLVLVPSGRPLSAKGCLQLVHPWGLKPLQPSLSAEYCALYLCAHRHTRMRDTRALARAISHPHSSKHPSQAA
jgi:hypothetical protein